jgi:hypothetical protein
MVYWQHIWPQILGTRGHIHNILFSFLTDILQGCFCYISDKFWTVTLPHIELWVFLAVFSARWKERK